MIFAVNTRDKLQFLSFIGALVGMIFQIFVSRLPKERCYCNQLNLGDVRKRRVERPLLFALAFDNELADRKFAFKRFNANNKATSCPNLVNFRPVIPEFTLLKRAIFAAIRPQFDDDLHSPRWRSKTDWKIEFDISRVIGNDFCTLCRNLVRFGSVTLELHKKLYSRRRLNDLYSLLRHSTTDWLIVNPLSKGSMAIIRLHPTTSEFTLLKRAIFAEIRPQFDDDLHSSRWRSQRIGRSQF